MTEETSAFRYRAFISYSHADERFSARLHRRLESFRVPRFAQKGEDVASGLKNQRIHPVFRDQEELSSSESLSDAIQHALDGSEALIVICSPTSAKSHWVNEEIKYFRRNFPERMVLPIVIGGDPGLSPRDNPELASFPLTLLLQDPDDPDSPFLEPLAADARKEADGFTIAFLKLVAGLLNVPFDRLRQREARRRQRRMALGVFASTALSVIFAIMAWRAIVARNEAREARAQAELELLSEQQTRSFLLSVFRLADPGEARGNSVTVREVLDRAVTRIDSSEFARPVIKSRFLATMGEAYSSLGINKRSVELLEQSLEELPADAVSKESWRQVIKSRLELADVAFDMGEYDKSLAYLEAVQSDPDHGNPELVQQARAVNIRGDVLSYQEQDAQAMEAYEQAMALSDDDSLNREEQAVIRHRALGGIAILHHFAGEFAEAQRYFKQSVDTIVPVFGELHPDSIWALISWGSAAYSNGDTAAAGEAWSRSLDIAIRVLGENHPEVGTIKNNLARLYLETGDYARSEEFLRASLAIDRAHRSKGFDDLAYPLTNLALVRLAQQDPDEALELLLEAQTVAELAGHRMLGPIRTNLADIYCERGNLDDGMLMADTAVNISRDEFGEDDWHTAHAIMVQAWCRSLNGDNIDLAKAIAASTALVDHWGEQSFFARRALEQKAAIEQR